MSSENSNYLSGEEYDKAYLSGTWEATYSTLMYVERILGFPIPKNDPLLEASLRNVSLEFIEETDEYLNDVEESGFDNNDNI